MIRLKTDRNQYLDITDAAVISNDNIQIYLDIPENLPMQRLRTSVTSPVAETENIFFYDILPVIAYTQFKDNVEKDDIIIKKIYADTESSNPYLLVLQVAETIGNLKHGFVTWKKHNTAPYNFALPQEVQDIINKFSLDTEI